MKTILITGGAGFLGSHLAENLLKLGNRIIVLDNFYTGDIANLSHLLADPNLEIIDQDVTHEIDIAVDQIYNLACPASPIHYQIDPVRTVRTNIHGTINVLELAKKYKAKILQASTSEVYGDPDIHPQLESYWGRVNPIGVRSCYDEGKRCAETLFFDYHRQYQIEIKIVRIFNTYGPRMKINDGRVISNFVTQALAGEDITIYGDGSQTRSFCYVDDLIDAMIRMMDTDCEITGPINVGNPKEITILELADMIRKLVKSQSVIKLCNALDDDPQRRNPSIRLANNLLGWHPSTSLEQGLQKTINYFTQILKETCKN